jgi:hypothetical protein
MRLATASRARHPRACPGPAALAAADLFRTNLRRHRGNSAKARLSRGEPATGRPAA